MVSIGKILLVFSVVLAVLGVLFIFYDKIPFIGKLPGDIRIEKENFRFYFPITSCIIISIIVTIIIHIISYFTKK